MTTHETLVQYIKIILAIVFLFLCVKSMQVLGQIEFNTREIMEGQKQSMISNHVWAMDIFRRCTNN